MNCEASARPQILGRSPAFAGTLDLAARVSAFDAAVLIEGETGTGKELLARELHHGSARRFSPFVPVNCGALPETLVENELFGHRRGAYTDARSDQPGLLELANDGTLFLDEIDSLCPRGQLALLRFTQDEEFRPLGSTRVQRANVRIIAASNRDLETLALGGHFRLDLFYRLRVLHFWLPPLRERPGDPALLAEHFVRVASERFGKPVLPIDRMTLDWLDRYSWPGNVRELEHLVYQAFLLATGSTLTILPPASVATDGPPTRREDSGHLPKFRHAKRRAIEEFERGYLREALHRARGNISQAARLIGTERRHLGRLLKKYQIAQPASSSA